jgi:hypothetical protein
MLTNNDLLGDIAPEKRGKRKQRLLENNDWIDQASGNLLNPYKIEGPDGMPYLVQGNVLWLRLMGQVAAKKNNWRPRRGGKGIFLDEKSRASIDGLAAQIPGALRDLRLRHPAIEVFTFVPLKGCDADVDNMWTSISDILVKYGVLAEDSIRHCNGPKLLHPAILWEVHATVVKLTAKEAIRI